MCKCKCVSKIIGFSSPPLKNPKLLKISEKKGLRRDCRSSKGKSAPCILPHTVWCLTFSIGMKSAKYIILEGFSAASEIFREAVIQRFRVLDSPCPPVPYLFSLKHGLQHRFSMCVSHQILWTQFLIFALGFKHRLSIISEYTRVSNLTISFNANITLGSKC